MSQVSVGSKIVAYDGEGYTVVEVQNHGVWIDNYEDFLTNDEFYTVGEADAFE